MLNRDALIGDRHTVPTRSSTPPASGDSPSHYWHCNPWTDRCDRCHGPVSHSDGTEKQSLSANVSRHAIRVRLGQPASADVHCARASCLSIWQLEAKSARCSWECAHLRTPSAYGFPDGGPAFADSNCDRSSSAVSRDRAG